MTNPQRAVLAVLVLLGSVGLVALIAQPKETVKMIENLFSDSSMTNSFVMPRCGVGLGYCQGPNFVSEPLRCRLSIEGLQHSKYLFAEQSLNSGIPINEDYEVTFGVKEIHSEHKCPTGIRFKPGRLFEMPVCHNHPASFTTAEQIDILNRHPLLQEYRYRFPVHFSVFRQSREDFEYYLASGYNPNELDFWGRTAFVFDQDQVFANLARTNGIEPLDICDVDYEYIIECSYRRDWSTVRQMIADRPELADARGPSGYTLANVAHTFHESDQEAYLLVHGSPQGVGMQLKPEDQDVYFMKRRLEKFQLVAETVRKSDTSENTTQLTADENGALIYPE